jgi:hypothetical protein
MRWVVFYAIDLSVREDSFVRFWNVPDYRATHFAETAASVDYNSQVTARGLLLAQAADTAGFGPGNRRRWVDLVAAVRGRPRPDEIRCALWFDPSPVGVRFGRSKDSFVQAADQSWVQASLDTLRSEAFWEMLWGTNDCKAVL